MNNVCGIYGYHVTHPINLTGHDLRIAPVTNDDNVVKLKADNRQSYQLTATLTGKSISYGTLFNLEAILSFIEGRDVLITSPENLTNEVSPGSQFAECINMLVRGRISNEAICRSKHASRTSFILNALDRLNYEEDKLKIEPREEGKDLPNIPLFNALFFKYVESFRQNIFPDIAYYLLFSGLEAFSTSWAEENGIIKEPPPGLFCKKCKYSVSLESCPTCKECGNITPKKLLPLPVSSVICAFLKKDGDVFGAADTLKLDTKKKKYDQYAAMAAYAHLRNKLVHENKFSSTSFKKSDGKTTVPLNLFEYKNRLETLVMLVILKEVGGADIDYKLWLTRQPI